MMREIKLYAAAGIFLALTAVKMLVPGAAAGVRTVIAEQIDKNIDYEAVIVTLGRKVNDYSDYFEREWAVFRSQESPAPTAAPTPTAEPTSMPEPAPERTPAPEPTPGLEPEPEAKDLPEPESAVQGPSLPFDYVYPLAALSVSSGFGERTHPIEGIEKFHYGLDLDAGEGEEISAFAAGRVVTAEYSESYGNYIVIAHDDVYSSLYAHCSSLLVQPGDQVAAGEKIALAGQTGRATGPHLHFELRENGVCIDPGAYLC